MRRRFIISLSISDLYNEKPLLARVISSSFYLSHGIRRDAVLYFYFTDHPTSLSFDGDRLRHVHVDEASLLGILMKIERHIRTGSKREKIHDGITITEKSKILRQRTLLVSSKGTPIEKMALWSTDDLTFLIPLRNNVTVDTRGPTVKVTACPKPADVTIAILNIKLDRLRRD